ncbi:MAG: 1-deoxy-D-xylulose-5-phosphate synthase [Simkaniaceae bacterium]|nr:1-deoxy-D-xylulose-5-phosphate synthase [Simkaniaceae bacterium]
MNPGDIPPSPEILRGLSLDDLRETARAVRLRIMDVLAETGGHLSSNLGVVELTVALHTVFDTPQDKLIFDVGHQAYPHKILTGRNPVFPTIRQTAGLSGFTHPEESPHDHFHAGHAGNALSLALGLAKQRDLKGERYRIIPVLGDAALTCGLTFEALNNIPETIDDLIIILNDNAMSIAKNVGATSRILDPGSGNGAASAFIGRFGPTYLGPVDGHDLSALISTFRDLPNRRGSKLIHVRTIKGYGMAHATAFPTSYHGAKPFDRKTGRFLPAEQRPTFPGIFGSELAKMTEKDPRIVSVTPAMPDGSCMTPLTDRFPERCVDVGIAEGHAVTYAGGIGAGGGCRVVVCVYSTFLQRAFDNLCHDVCIQKTALLLAVDRAGLAAGDGVTAHGIYDLGFLYAMPGVVIAQPRNGAMLRALMQSAFAWNRPVIIRYPNLPTTDTDDRIPRPSLGTGTVMTDEGRLVIIALGHMVETALRVRKLLAVEGISSTVIDPVFIKPLDENVLKEHIAKAEGVITIEEHALANGFGMLIHSFMIRENLRPAYVRSFGVPDTFVSHGSYADLIDRIGLSPEKITREVLVSLTASGEIAR